MTCDDSKTALGTGNLSTGTGGIQGDKGSTVIDIIGLKPSPASTSAYGWVYFTYGTGQGDGAIFIQYNPNVGGNAFSKFLGHALAAIPAFGPLIDAGITAIADSAAQPTQITPKQWSAIQQAMEKEDADMNGGGDTIHECFSKGLQLT